jgi:hypothetical protein
MDEDQRVYFREIGGCKNYLIRQVLWIGGFAITLIGERIYPD